MELEYNTQRPYIVLKEYGRNIQKLASYVKGIEGAEKRTEYAKTLTDLMRQINPSLKDNPEYGQKVWDDLYIISDFSLEVDSPFPMPEKAILGKKPQQLTYKKEEIKYRHYGRNVEVMIEKAIEMEDPESREAAIIHIGRLMKSFYASWNKDNINEEVIIKHIEELSEGKLTINTERVKEEGLFNSNIRERRQSSRDSREYQNKKRNFQKRRRN